MTHPLHALCRRGHRDDRGIVTAEFALLLPTLFLVLALVLSLISALGEKVKVVDASREAARVAARGDSDATAVAAATRLAPHGASVELSSRGGYVQAVVTARIEPLGLLPALTLRSSTLALREGP